MELPKVVWSLPKVVWQGLPGVREPIPLRVFSGVSGMDPYSIADSYATRIKNMTSHEYPALSVRPGYSQVGTTFGSFIQGLDSYKNTELHAISGGSWYKWNGTSWVSLASGLNAAALWSFCNFKGNFGTMNMIGANGVDAPRRYDGTSVQVLAGAPAGGKFVDQHDNRVYLAVGNMVHVSALRKGDDWTTAKDAQQIAVENDNGEDIVGLKAGAGHVVVFLPNSVHELWGTGPKDYRMQIVAEDIGLINNQCTANLGGILYFLDSRGVFRYSGGTVPSREFSILVEDYIQNMNLAAKDQCSLGTDGKKLYVSFPSAGSSFADTILEYNPQFNGIWCVWKDIQPHVFTKMGADLYIGDHSGRVLKMGGTTDNGAAISWEWVSKTFGGSSLAQNLSWYRLWYSADIPAGSTMNVHLSKSATGDSDWILVKTITSTDKQTGKIMIPVNAVANANWLRVKFSGTGPVTIHEFDRQQRELPLT